MKLALMAGMMLKSAGRTALCKLLLLVLCVANIGVSSSSRGSIDIQVANITAAAPGWPRSYPELQPLQGVAQSTVCKGLNGLEGVVYCFAFFSIEENALLSVQMEVRTTTVNASYSAYTKFKEYTSATSVFLAELTDAANALQGIKVLPLIWMSSMKTVPCRSLKKAALLPTCSGTKNCAASLVIEGASGEIQKTLCSFLSTPCEKYLNVSALPNGNTQADISASNALDVALQFTSIVRKDENMGVKRVLLRSGERMSQMYARSEKMRYKVPLETTIECDSTFGLWTLSILVLVPVLLLIFRYVWYRARHRAKKVTRRAIIDNEMQLQMQERQQPMGPQYNVYDQSGYMYPQHEDEEREAGHEQDFYYYTQREGNEDHDGSVEYDANAYDGTQHAMQYEGQDQFFVGEEEDADALYNADEYVEPDVERSTADEGEEEAQMYYTGPGYHSTGSANKMSTDDSMGNTGGFLR